MDTPAFPPPERRREATCRICGLRGEMECWSVREMMFGSRERFEYVRCGECDCIQIAEIPDDLTLYYPPGYYAHATPDGPGRVAARLRAWRNRAFVRGRHPPGALIGLLLPYPPEGPLAPFRRLRPPLTARILDVGCGSGEFLLRLHEVGYRDLHGVDPHLAEDAQPPAPGIRLVRGEVGDLADRFDVVVLNHALEHVADQHALLAAIRGRVPDDGTVVVRIPVVPSIALARYGTDWVQWDAPRHLYLHSEESLRRLAREHGFRIADSWHDSTAFQLTGSAAYRADVPLEEAGGLEGTRAQRREARRLNDRRAGDQAVFILRPEPA